MTKLNPFLDFLADLITLARRGTLQSTLAWMVRQVGTSAGRDRGEIEFATHGGFIPFSRHYYEM